MKLFEDRSTISTRTWLMFGSVNKKSYRKDLYMKKGLKLNVGKWVSVGAIFASVALVPATSFAAASNTSSGLNGLLNQASSAKNSQNSQVCGALCQQIQSAGAQEISMRLTSLNSAATKISQSTHLSASDKSYLSTEVSGEITGLTALQTKLAADTSLNTAISDAKSIFSDYRVYALVLPKVNLVATSDGQQTTESNLTNLATQLQAKITQDSKAGKNVSTLQTDLNNMISSVNTAQGISTSIEQKVLTLQPSDFNSNHDILTGDLAQLKTAHADNESAYADAKTIVAGLKSL